MITRQCMRCRKDRNLNGFATRGGYRRLCRFCDKRTDWGEGDRIAMIRQIFGDIPLTEVARLIDIHRSNLYRWLDGSTNTQSTVPDAIAEFIRRKRDAATGRCRVLH